MAVVIGSAAAVHATLVDQWLMNENGAINLTSSGTWGTTLNAHPTYGANWISTPGSYGLDFTPHSMFTSSAGWGSSLTQMTMAAWMWVDDGAQANIRQFVFTAGDADVSIVLNRAISGYDRDVYIHSYMGTAPSYVLPKGEWVHVAFVVEGEGGANQEYIYVNGVQKQARNSVWSKPTPANRRISLGIALTGGEWFYGKMDELSIYDTAMTQGEVEALYLAGPVVVPEPSIMVMLVGALAVARRRRK